jgi:hypothetical protein
MLPVPTAMSHPPATSGPPEILNWQFTVSFAGTEEGQTIITDTSGKGESPWQLQPSVMPFFLVSPVMPSSKALRDSNSTAIKISVKRETKIL